MGHRYQHVLLNGQESDWLTVKADIPKGSILGSLLFLIYIYDLPDNLTSTVKFFADDTSLFSTVINSDILLQELNEDLKTVADRA